MGVRLSSQGRLSLIHGLKYADIQDPKMHPPSVSRGDDCQAPSVRRGFAISRRQSRYVLKDMARTVHSLVVL
jgi:hypothetical protein